MAEDEHLVPRLRVSSEPVLKQLGAQDIIPWRQGWALCFRYFQGGAAVRGREGGGGGGRGGVETG